LSDFAILSLGAVTVPIYPSLTAGQIKYILRDSESLILICANQEQYLKAEKVRNQCPNLRKIIVMDSDEKSENYLTLEELEDVGKKIVENKSGFPQQIVSEIKSNELATIIYTSGTTGEPKGAMLIHSNLISNIEASLTHLPINENDIFLSFLPLSHSFERMAGHFLSNYRGSTVAYAVSVDTVAENMAEVKPTIMTSVPRLYEKIYARILENVESGPALKRKIFYWAIEVGRQYIHKVMRKESIGGWLKIKRKLAYQLVFSKLAERVGGKMRFFISGGAPLSREIAEFFGAAGLIIYEGYGLTETSPVIAVNKYDLFKFGTVGPVIPGVEVKIGDDGEIITRGPNVMKGYFKKEEETMEALDPDGWFHTGDIGFLDEDGCLTITDRKKNILVTSGGKNIAPQPIENQLVTCKFIEQAVLIGDQKKFCTAVIVPAFEALENWAQEKGIAYDEPSMLSQLQEVKDLIKEEVEDVNDDLASYETIKDFIIVDKPFTIETGELTPSLKVKRKVVMEKFQEQIDKMYQVSFNA
jgi:long-chain acyl-CoA synthetase